MGGGLNMKKTYIQPVTEIEAAQTIDVFASSTGVNGKLGDTLEIGWGGADTNGSLDPSSNGFGSWDDESWDKL